MNYYIGIRGDDGKSGESRQEAWASFAPLAAVELGPGDAIRIEAGGTWNEPLRLTGTGTEEAPIRLETFGDEGDSLPAWDDGFARRARPRIVWSEGPVVELVSVSHWIIRGIEIECASEESLYPELAEVDDPSQIGDVPRHPKSDVNHGLLVRSPYGRRWSGILIDDVHVYGRGPNQNSEGILVSAETTSDATDPTLTEVVIRNCLVEDVGWRGIGTGSTAIDPNATGIPWLPIRGLTMEGNAARRIGLQGICAFNATDVVMRHNLVDGAGQYHGVGAKWGPAGLWPWSCANVLLEYNEVTNMFDGNTGADATGIDIDWNSHHVTVRANHCYGNMGCGIVTMSCRDSSIVANRVEGNLCKVNMGSGQIGICDYQTARGPHAITGVTDLEIRDNLVVLDRDNTSALSTVRISGGEWERISFTDNRIVFFDHARDHYAYDIQEGTSVESIDDNSFYGIDEGSFGAVEGERSLSLEQWRASGRDRKSRVDPLDGTGPRAVTGARASVSGARVRLDWSAAADSLSGVHHYNVYRGSRPGFAPRYVTMVGQPEAPGFTDEPGPGIWWYKIEAEDACGNRCGRVATVEVQL